MEAQQNLHKGILIPYFGNFLFLKSESMKGLNLKHQIYLIGSLIFILYCEIFSVSPQSLFEGQQNVFTITALLFISFQSTL